MERKYPQTGFLKEEIAAFWQLYCLRKLTLDKSSSSFLYKEFHPSDDLVCECFLLGIFDFSIGAEVAMALEMKKNGLLELSEEENMVFRELDYLRRVTSGSVPPCFLYKEFHPSDDLVCECFLLGKGNSLTGAKVAIDIEMEGREFFESFSEIGKNWK